MSLRVELLISLIVPIPIALIASIILPPSLLLLLVLILMRLLVGPTDVRVFWEAIFGASLEVVVVYLRCFPTILPIACIVQLFFIHFVVRLMAVLLVLLSWIGWRLLVIRVGIAEILFSPCLAMINLRWVIMLGISVLWGIFLAIHPYSLLLVLLVLSLLLLLLLLTVLLICLLLVLTEKLFLLAEVVIATLASDLVVQRGYKWRDFATHLQRLLLRLLACPFFSTRPCMAVIWNLIHVLLIPVNHLQWIVVGVCLVKVNLIHINIIFKLSFQLSLCSFLQLSL